MHNFQIVDLEQGSPEWLAWREARYGASEAAAVLGMSAFFPRTPRQLQQVKTGQRQVFVSAAMRSGSDAEPRARELITQLCGHEVMPLCVEADVDGIPLCASFDAVSTSTEEAYEIKRPASGSKSDLWGGAVNQYLWQMVHQLITYPAIERVSLAVYAHDLDEVKIVYSLSRFDPSFDQHAERLIAGWRSFHECMQSLKQPEAMILDRIDADDREWEDLAEDFLAAKRMLEIASAKVENARRALIADADRRGAGAPVRGCGVSVAKSSRAGAIDWKAEPIRNALALAGVNPGDYRGRPVDVWSVSEIEENGDQYEH